MESPWSCSARCEWLYILHIFLWLIIFLRKEWPRWMVCSLQLHTPCLLYKPVCARSILIKLLICFSRMKRMLFEVLIFCTEELRYAIFRKACNSWRDWFRCGIVQVIFLV
jgi:hypothetical protein